MKIPFIELSKEKEFLEQLGFDFTRVEKKGRYFYLELPPSLSCEQTFPDFDCRIFTIYLQGNPIIDIAQRINLKDDACCPITFYYEKKEIDAALSTHGNTALATGLTPLVKNIHRNLDDLKFYTENINHGGYYKHIKSCLDLMLHYAEQYPGLCAQIIANDDDNLRLYTIYNRWQDDESILIYGMRNGTDTDKNTRVVSLDNIMEGLKLIPLGNKIKTEFSLLAEENKNNSTEIGALKQLCFDYADDIYRSNRHDRNNKIEALKQIRAGLDTANTIEQDKPKLEKIVNNVKHALKQDNDFRAIRFLKEFGRILKAVFTLSYDAHKHASIKKYGSPKFWQSEERLRAKNFVREIKLSIHSTTLKK